jgi:hypothetical protein
MRSRMESRVEERWLGPIWAAAMVMGRFGDAMLVVVGGCSMDWSEEPLGE